MPQSRLTSPALALPGPIEAIEEFFARGWSDGLPVVPPTEDAVAAMLDAAGMPPDSVLGVEPTKGHVVTAEKAAINAVMAGCRPDYFPVVAAAVEAMTDDAFALHGPSVSTMGAAMLVIVNGPIANDLGMNSGVSVFGPGNRANATIGRAVRLILMNVLGTRAGELDKGTLGHPGRYTWCIAEAESKSPWEPLHVTRGMPVGSSAVTVVAGLSGIQMGDHASNTPEGILDSFIHRISALGPAMREVVLVFCPEHIAHFERAGWPKSQVGRYLYVNSRKPRSEWAALRFPPEWSAGDPDEVVGALASPEAVLPLVAGGDGGAWSMIIPTWTYGAKTRAVTKEIRHAG